MFKSLFLFFLKSFKTKTQLKLKILSLSKQLEILQRTSPKNKFSRSDRLFFCLIKDFLSNWKERLFIIKPETVIKWHKTLLLIIYHGVRPGFMEN
jgi:hypothetical protein